MAAGQGFKTFTVGEVLTASDVNGYLMQGVLVFASAAARTSAITSPQEGQYSYLKDTNSLEFYDGSAWVTGGDITGVTAGTGISGGGTGGDVTITNTMATAIDAKGDLVVGTGADTFSRLAVGANDTVLTADSTTATGVKWATAGAAGGMTLLSTTALSGTSTTVSSISQSYKNLMIFINSITFSAAAELNITFNSITNYYTARSSNAAWTADNATSKIKTSISSVSFGGTIITVPQYSVASYHTGQLQSFDFNNGANLFNAFSINSSAALNSFTVTSAAGTATMSAGNIYIYGVN